MNRLPIDWRRVAVIAGVIFLVLVIVDFNSRLDELNRLNQQAEIVRTEATQAALTQVALQIQVTYASSDQAAEDYARDEGHMKKEGDHTVTVIGQGGDTPVTTPAPAVSLPPPKPNWQLWWDLYFGKE